MGFFRRGNKTQRIGTLETSIARLASEIMQIKGTTEKIQEGVEDIQKTIHTNHIAHATCETMQDGRWKEHLAEHKALQANQDELTQVVQRLTEDVRILSANITRIGDRQRQMDTRDA